MSRPTLNGGELVRAVSRPVTVISMPCQPVIMVLYTNDAVEVRYSDDSRLHILPCGTSFSYHTNDAAHPVHGLSCVQQRSCFVTSSYRDMLLAALDFRNRFSERPLLCSHLLDPEQIVSLYANIAKIAWPKQADSGHCEVLNDGSIRIRSVDEFASLILSPHRKDFTICYLSLLSEEKVREKKSSRDLHKCKKRDKVVDQRRTQTNDEYNGNISNESQRSNTSDEVAQIEQARLERLELRTNGLARSQHDQKPVDLNISPITQASCNDSPRSQASGSPVTPRNAAPDADAKFRQFSTPTEGFEEEEPFCTPFAETAVFKDYQGKSGKTKDLHSDIHDRMPRLVESQSKNRNSHNSENIVPQNIQNKTTDFQQQTSQNTTSTRTSTNRASSHQSYTSHYYSADKCSEDSMGFSVSTGSEASRDSSGRESQTRRRYCWVTRHISCDECPLAWSQVVKMVQDVAQNGIVEENKVPKRTCPPNQGPQALRRIDRDECIFSTVPAPLPLTCPGQHLHKTQKIRTYTDGKNPLEDPSTLSQGRIKVVLINGTIFRIVRLASMKLIEVYPGDGSVLLSQGMTAHFFLHIIPQQGKLEERTYSIKSLPTTMAGSHTVKSLIGRAHRFLAHVLQEENSMSVPQGMFCWKYKETPIIHPQATSVLEECTISGCGKFTALTNGQVRVVFQDRTSLDMTWDFSRRKTSPENLRCHGDDRLLLSKKSDTCRLLLPNGQYVLVELAQPGMYRRYIDMATEWAEWVNATPDQRKYFYKDRQENTSDISVERELQKISCFSYIVDNTVLRKTDTGGISSSQASANSYRPATGILKSSKSAFHPKSDQNKVQLQDRETSSNIYNKPRSVHIHSPPSSNKSDPSFQQTNSVSYISTTESSSRTLIGQSSTSDVLIPPTSVRPNPIGQLSSGKTLSLEGFNAVKEALMRTSNFIKDIDGMLAKK